MTKLQLACKQEITRCFIESAERYPKYAERLQGVPIKWSTRMTHTAGKAKPGHFYPRGNPIPVRIGEYIKLSLPLLETEQENFVKRTPGHEAAHIITWIVFGVRGHGWQWKMVARELGIADTRCHRYNTPAKKRRERFHVYCGCGTSSVTKIILDRMKRGIQYRCQRCRQRPSLNRSIQAVFSIADKAEEKA